MNYNQEPGMKGRRRSITFCHVVAAMVSMVTEASEKKSLKTGDLMLSKWEEEIEEGTKTQWLQVCLGNHNEENGSWEVFWLIRKNGCYASELVDGEPLMSKGITAEDLRPLNSSKSTVLKPRGVKGSGSVCWAYFMEHVVDETGKVVKHITHCVTSEKGEQCWAKLNLTSAGTGTIINHLSAKHGINLQRGLVRQTETTASIKQKCDAVSKPYDKRLNNMESQVFSFMQIH